MKIVGLFMQGTWLDLFAEDEPDTAFAWVITSIVVAVLGAAVVFGFKALRKSTAGTLAREVWTRRRTWLSIFVGLFPIFLTLIVVWYMTRDYFDFIQVGGLLKGTIFAWLTYLFLMVVGHLVSPWRRELI